MNLTTVLTTNDEISTYFLRTQWKRVSNSEMIITGTILTAH